VSRAEELKAIVSRVMADPEVQWTKAGKRHGRKHQMVTDVEIKASLVDGLCRCHSSRPSRRLRICRDLVSGNLLWARLTCCGFKVE
jgi:hypothetical protein